MALAGSPLLPDEVWTRLDPYEGALSRRTAKRIWWAIGTAAALAAVSLLVWRSGLVVPNLAWPSESGSYSYQVDARHFRHDVLIANHGWRTVTITGVGRSGPGLRLVGGDAGFAGATLSPGGEVTVAVEYDVTDCAAVPTGEWPVPVRVSRAWGSETVYVRLPTVEAADAPASYSYSGNRSPYAVEWQRALADRACAA